MQEAALSPLIAWESFYVITGSAAAALTGLQFVVIVLSTQLNRGSSEANRAFGTPTIVHFGMVLALAALLSAPWPSLGMVAWILGGCGCAGLLYAVVVLQTARRQTDYQPVLEDWVWHFLLPPLADAILLGAAFQLTRHPTGALFAVGGTVLLLLFVGIHNAWDAATFMALQPRQQRERQEDERFRRSPAPRRRR